MSTDTKVRTIPFARPWITDEDRQAVAKVLDGFILTHGPECKAFEENFTSFLGPNAHAVSVSSCMAALHLSYLHFGVGPGDEVIVPAQTHIATVHAVEWVGATPVFVDCDPLTGNMLPESIAGAITARTKAIGVVHFLGIPCDMPEIMKIAEANNLVVIEDCALAVGSRIGETHVGLFGDAGCFSFYPVKHMTTAEGGMFVTRHAAVAQNVARLRAFGVDRAHAERNMPGYYDVPSLGLNYRMSELQAALGKSQVSRIGENLARRKRNFVKLKEALSALQDLRILDSQSGDYHNSHYCLSVVLEKEMAPLRNSLLSRLKEVGVGTSIYYPQPVPRMEYYQKKYGYIAAKYANAVEISDCSIALPVGPHLEADDLDYLSSNFIDTFKELQ